MNKEEIEKMKEDCIIDYEVLMDKLREHVPGDCSGIEVEVHTVSEVGYISNIYMDNGKLIISIKGEYL